MTIKIDQLLSYFSLAARKTTKKTIYKYLLGLKEQGLTDVKFVDFLEKFYVEVKLNHSTTLETIIKKLFNNSGRSILGRYITHNPEHNLNKSGDYLQSLNRISKHQHIYRYIINNSELEPLQLANFLEQLYAINNLEQHQLIEFDITELLHSVIATYPDLLAFISFEGINLNNCWTIYSNALHHALSLFTTSAAHVMVLVDGGADCNVRNKYGSTILHYLAKKAYEKDKLSKWLQACIDKGAKTSIRDIDGFTASELYFKTHKIEAPILKTVEREPTIDDKVSYFISNSIFGEQPILPNYPPVQIDFKL